MTFIALRDFFLALSVFASPDITAGCEVLMERNPIPQVRVVHSVPVRDREDLPAFCQIQGVIDPSIGFEARFPLTEWNGKYYQAGCGGFCGRVLPDRETHSNAINHALRRGYATITTDSGHEGETIGDASWANNPEVEKLYAGEVLPRTHAAAHQLIKDLYGDEPDYSYFSGCSNGGRLAGKAAQDYPNLFDGIISGCPVLNLSINGGVFGAWVMQANRDEHGKAILDDKFVEKLPMLEANALRQCDGLDGDIDGAIQKPEICTVSLDSIPDCVEGNAPSCMTAVEKKVVNMLYQGPVNTRGVSLFYGLPPSSERYWRAWYLGNEENPPVGTLLAEGYLPYLGFAEDPEGYSVMDFDFDRDVGKLATQGALLDALKPDLRAFKKAGGKMIMWHGRADPLVLPGQSVDYYEAVRAEMGQDQVDSFFRLFMVPGMGHCWELPAALPDRMDMLAVLENWVEKGIAPEEVLVSELVQAGQKAQTGRTGILRPYPGMATYSPF